MATYAELYVAVFDVDMIQLSQLQLIMIHVDMIKRG